MSPISCGAYVCNGPGTACLTSCNYNANGDAECASGYYCNGGPNGACQPKKAPGSGNTCSLGHECTTRFLRRRLLLQRLRVRHLPDLLLGLVRQRRQRSGRTARPLPREPALRQHRDLHRRRLHPGRGRHQLRRRLLPERDDLPARGEVQRGGKLFDPGHAELLAQHLRRRQRLPAGLRKRHASARAAPTATRARARRRKAWAPPAGGARNAPLATARKASAAAWAPARPARPARSRRSRGPAKTCCRAAPTPR